jgi:hypothetical protein
LYLGSVRDGKLLLPPPPLLRPLLLLLRAGDEFTGSLWDVTYKGAVTPYVQKAVGQDAMVRCMQQVLLLLLSHNTFSSQM